MEKETWDAIDVIEQYLNEISGTGYYNDDELEILEAAWSAILKALKE